MTKSAGVYALDAIRLIDQIGSFTLDMTATNFEEQAVVRLAVERPLIGLGEALSGLRCADPKAASQIFDLDRAIGLRNILARNDEGRFVDRLWDAVISPPTLRTPLQGLLAEPTSTTL